jgi:RnfABCDGE-type electron transport complex B subunit
MPTSLIGGLGLIFGLGLAFASKKFEVKVDERVARVREVLPGANCGACGQTGCDSFAEGLVEGKCKTNGCPVGGEELVKKLSEILGVKAEATVSKTARVICAGTFSSCKVKFDYSGIEDCVAAANLFGGSSSCSFGCVGMGNCVRACPFGARR